MKTCAVCGRPCKNILCGKECSIAWGKLPEQRKKNIEGQQKSIPCLPCLRKLGYGAKAIARRLRHPVGTVKRHLAHLPKPQLARRSYNLGETKSKRPKPSTPEERGQRQARWLLSAQRLAFEEEWKAKEYCGAKVDWKNDCNHWFNHPIAKVMLRRWRHSEHRRKRTNYGISKIVRCRIRNAMKRQYRSATKRDRTMKLLGCDWQQFRAYIESRFKRGMSWRNHGEWHLDHIVPCAAFDLRKHEDQAKCFHFSNYQPLWAEDNRRKGGNIKPCQPELLLAIGGRQ